MKKYAYLVICAVLSVGLTACPSGNKGGTAAATPPPIAPIPGPINCQWNWNNNGYIDANGTACTPNPGSMGHQNYCHNYTYNPMNQGYYGYNGSQINCQPGYIDYNNVAPYWVQGQANCAYWDYTVGGRWFPMYIGMGLVCVRESYVQGYIPGFMYNPGQGYYFPPMGGGGGGWYGGGGIGGGYGYGYGGSGMGYGYPYTCVNGVDCSTACINIGGMTGGSNYLFGGSLGMCF